MGYGGHGPNSALDSYVVGGPSAGKAAPVIYNGQFGPVMSTSDPLSRSIHLIYLQRGYGDEDFLKGVALLQQFLQQEFPGLPVDVKPFLWPDPANAFATANPIDFNCAIVHGDMTQLDQYKGAVIIHGTRYDGNYIDGNGNYTQTFHCGQGPNGTSITLSTIAKAISQNVRSFFPPGF